MLAAEPGAAVRLLLRGINQLFGFGSFAVPVLLIGVGGWLILRHFGGSLPLPEPYQVGGGAMVGIAALVLAHSILVALEPNGPVYFDQAQANALSAQVRSGQLTQQEATRILVEEHSEACPPNPQERIDEGWVLQPAYPLDILDIAMCGWGGGYAGGFITLYMVQALGVTPTIVIATSILAVGLMVFTQTSLEDVMVFLKLRYEEYERYREKTKQGRTVPAATEEEEEPVAQTATRAGKAASPAAAGGKAAPAKTDEKDEKKETGKAKPETPKPAQAPMAGRPSIVTGLGPGGTPGKSPSKPKSPAGKPAPAAASKAKPGGGKGQPEPAAATAGQSASAGRPAAPPAPSGRPRPAPKPGSKSPGSGSASKPGAPKPGGPSSGASPARKPGSSPSKPGGAPTKPDDRAGKPGGSGKPESSKPSSASSPSGPSGPSPSAPPKPGGPPRPGSSGPRKPGESPSRPTSTSSPAKPQAGTAAAGAAAAAGGSVRVPPRPGGKPDQSDKEDDTAGQPKAKSAPGGSTTKPKTSDSAAEGKTDEKKQPSGGPPPRPGGPKPSPRSGQPGGSPGRTFGPGSPPSFGSSRPAPKPGGSAKESEEDKKDEADEKGPTFADTAVKDPLADAIDAEADVKKADKSASEAETTKPPKAGTLPGGRPASPPKPAAPEAGKPAGPKAANPAESKTDKPPAAEKTAEKQDAKPDEKKTPSAEKKPGAPPKLPTEEDKPYRWSYPTVDDILEFHTEKTVSDDALRERAAIIESTLSSFGAPGRVVEVNRGPVITQFGVEPDYIDGRGGKRIKVKVGKISGLSDDIALALAAPSIRIEAPVPGKGYVGIEVPNPEASIVGLRDVMDTPEFRKVSSPLRLALGQDVAGNPVVADLTTMPHLLIAGTTGSGKSVCVNGIICTMLMNLSPDELKFIMVDPKRVELTNYNGIPHLMSPVVTELERIVGVLKWAQREMDDRYRKFAAVGSRNIVDYNDRIERGQIKDDKLPYIVLIVDELADLMMLAPDETERLITRLAQMARATGIHIIISTQRPSVDVVTGLIKANFPARIAFAVATGVDSRVIMDMPGAEKLLGRGDMLFQPPDAPMPLRMQGVYLSDAEIRKIVDHWRQERINSGMPEPKMLVSATGNGSSGGRRFSSEEEGKPTVQRSLFRDDSASDDDGDDLFDEAVELVQDMGKASISLLQRHLRIGYTRAARLIDMMEERDIIGPHEGGSKPREVLGPDGEPINSDDEEDDEE
ncbi:MAG: DNA translocase FtsK [Anaerolineae bacterium]